MTDPVIVVGAGIAGLAAAFQLQRDGMPVQVIEADDRVGGKIRSSEVAGRLVDEGADAFLARVPHGIELARELGLAGSLISPAARRAQVWRAGDGGSVGSLCDLPEPNVLGIPLDGEAAAELLGAQAAADLADDLARTEPDPVRPDDTIGSLVRRRLGDRIHEALVDPLLGAVNAGDTDQLDVAAASPQIAAAADSDSSLVRALRAQLAARGSDAPVFHSFPGGMRVLVDALHDRLGEHVTTGVAVTAVDRRPDGQLVVRSAEGESLTTPAVVLTTPPGIAASLLHRWPAASAAMAAIPLVGVSMVTLAFPNGSLDVAAELSGFVVPRASSLTITACSYASSKWPDLGADVELVRVSFGHALDQATPDLPDDQLLAIARRDLQQALGVTAEPIEHRVTRWPAAFPQYLPGHLDRVARIEGELNPDGIFIAGMGYRGIGIPANIDQGRQAAVQAILHVLDRVDT